MEFWKALLKSIIYQKYFPAKWRKMLAKPVTTVVYTGFCAWGEVLFSLEKAKISRFCKLENFQKMLKNQWKFYNSWKFFRKFCDFLKMLSKFSRQFREKYRQFCKCGFVGGSGGGAPRS